MHHHRYATPFAVIVVSCAAASTAAQPPDTPPPPPGHALEIGDLLVKRNLADAVADLQRRLEQAPDDDTARFGLGMAQFLSSGENLFRSLYRHGHDPDMTYLAWVLGIMQWPVPVNPNPLEITYEDMRGIIERWREDLLAADRTLAAIDDDQVKLRLRLGIVMMDFDDDGAAEPDEALFGVFNRAQRRFTATREIAEIWHIAFDRGDVDWLRGYIHICTALAELALACDWRDIFERTAHLNFQKPVTPYPYLVHRDSRQWGDNWKTVDFIAVVHGLRCEVVEPMRCRAALDHLLAAIELSHGMWNHYNAETDDDYEWIPNPGQQAVIPRGAVTKEQQETWRLFLDEAAALLRGERLLRFWRTADGENRAEGLGVNVHRLFTEPRTFDLVYWVQGTAALPYLEEGMLTEPQIWARLEEAFNRHTFRHMWWFN